MAQRHRHYRESFRKREFDPFTAYFNLIKSQADFSLPQLSELCGSERADRRSYTISTAFPRGNSHHRCLVIYARDHTIITSHRQMFLVAVAGEGQLPIADFYILFHV
ncbi:hypothetical protein FOZ60_000610 [Perkinsus olseni]|uniref:Uncharacterized protein n=1 Tax=Perkinsus olseni TaxID=32597 RepID=A0A7J6P233_PEROL|nr:hypothetical protein FOZ60_000610 [Perkinsus olseni]